MQPPGSPIHESIILDNDPAALDAHIGMTSARPRRVAVVYKQRPADFVVEEVSLDGDINSVEGFQPASSVATAGAFVAFTLVKEGLTTFDAIRRVACELDVPIRCLTYAGLKDSRARTAQAVHVERRLLASVRELDLGNLRLVDPRPAGQPLRRGALWGNYFRIVVRPERRITQVDLDRERDWLVEHGIVNYFGQQRFGRRMNLHGVGRLLVAGREEEAVRTFSLDTNCLESAGLQSARRTVAEAWPDPVGMAQIARRENPRGLDQEIELLERIAQTRDWSGIWEMPMIADFSIQAWVSYLFNLAASDDTIRSFDDELPFFDGSPETTELYQRVCGVERLPASISTRSRPHVSNGSRPTKIRPVDCHFQIRNNSPVLRFALRKGSYATSLLRTIFRPAEGGSFPPRRSVMSSTTAVAAKRGPR